MNEKKLKQLFGSARTEPVPSPLPGFAADVLAAVHTERRPAAAGSQSTWEHLNTLFPRVALAAVVVIVLCVAADWGLTEAGLPGVSDGVAQATSQYLFNSEDL